MEKWGTASFHRSFLGNKVSLSWFRRLRIFSLLSSFDWFRLEFEPRSYWISGWRMGIRRTGVLPAPGLDLNWREAGTVGTFLLQSTRTPDKECVKWFGKGILIWCVGKARWWLEMTNQPLLGYFHTKLDSCSHVFKPLNRSLHPPAILTSYLGSFSNEDPWKCKNSKNATLCKFTIRGAMGRKLLIFVLLEFNQDLLKKVWNILTSRTKWAKI